MNERTYDKFLQPLKNRPDLDPDQEFKQRIQNKLQSIANAENHRTERLGKHAFPRLLTAALLFFGLFIGYEVVVKDKTILQPKHGEQVKNIEELTQPLAEKTVDSAFSHVIRVYNEGSMDKNEVFSYKGKSYRYMSEEFNSKEKILHYLQETYTKELANRIYGVLNLIEYKGKLAQPDRIEDSNLVWSEASVASRKQIDETSWSIEYKVPVVKDPSDQFRYYHIQLKFEDGWKLDGALPFTTPRYIIEKRNAESSNQSTSVFKLTDHQMTVYTAFSKDLKESHLKELDPVSVAMLYIQAQMEGRYDIAYALYTDREGYVNWTKEDDERIPASDRMPKEQVPILYSGITEGEFIKTGEFTGYIKFTNSGSEHGFQMIQDEDGIWNVAFIPMQ